jgi:hypothetical protein
VKKPAPFDLIARRSPLASFVKVTAAFGITAPVSSFTVPDSDAVITWANPALANTASAATAVSHAPALFHRNPSPDRDPRHVPVLFMWSPKSAAGITFFSRPKERAHALTAQGSLLYVTDLNRLASGF